jgi:hypothetical protein
VTPIQTGTEARKGRCTTRRKSTVTGDDPPFPPATGIGAVADDAADFTQY